MIGDEPAGSVTECLGADHRRLDAILAEAKTAWKAGNIDSARTRFGEFRDGLDRHIEVEERVLFPVFERLTGIGDAGPTHVMRMEHAELRRLMAEVAASLESGGDAAEAPPLADLTVRIHAHNGKEERVLYPATDDAARKAGTLEDLLRRLELS